MAISMYIALQHAHTLGIIRARAQNIPQIQTKLTIKWIDKQLI